MDERPDQIKTEIDSKRDLLSKNLNELESRVRSAADWRTQFDRYPLAFLGAAIGGGMLLSSAMASKRGNGSGKSYSSPAVNTSTDAGATSSVPSLLSQHVATDYQRRRASEAIDNIRGALIGYAASRAKEFLNEILPGFDQQYKETEAKAKASSKSASAPPQPDSYLHQY